MSNFAELYTRASRTIPGGVNSPVRAFNGVGGDPIFIKRADGAYMYDQFDKPYIDYVMSWGPMIHGHNHSQVREAVINASANGLSFGAPTEIEIDMAEKVCEMIPGIEQVRMVSSGTEATMSAIRLARGFTGRNKLLKFEGCYHGHADCLLVKAGSGALTLGEPTSPGVPEDFAKHTLTATFNDLDSVKHLFAEHPEDIATVIVEPIAGNMNCIPPTEGFLEGLRAVCDEYGALLIFDEVMCGFRVPGGSAQALYNVIPDLTCLGKVIGGGMPVGAFGGRFDVMQYLAPAGPVYQAGTLSGNPVAMTAGLTSLSMLQQEGYLDSVFEFTSQLLAGLQSLANEASVPMSTNQVGSMFGVFFSNDSKITQYQQVADGNIDHFKRFFHGMLERGVYLAPSAFEAGFTSKAHGSEQLDQTLSAAKAVFQQF